uniref:Uncharacterized protein MANES_08G172200 n=1 Tax=Rhizophora mucronata TaxID=61149 RepID=A0A2P2L6H8_RHIMU
MASLADFRADKQQLGIDQQILINRQLRIRYRTILTDSSGHRRLLTSSVLLAASGTHVPNSYKPQIMPESLISLPPYVFVLKRVIS